MGTDIQMYAEHRDDSGWHPIVGKLYEGWRSPDYDPEGPPELVYDERNRDLHGLLLDRFSGPPLNGEFGSVQGLPDDLSPQIAAEFAGGEEDAYWPSWLLLSEVLAMPWHKRFKDPYTGWERTFADLAGPEFMDDVVEYFRAKYDDPSRVRLVYWMLA